jgi:hypothetical protein
MKIIDVIEQPVKACAYFEYKGFEISSSSIMSQRSIVDSIKVWDENGVAVFFGKTIYTVEEAIEKVNKLVGE